MAATRVTGQRTPHRRNRCRPVPYPASAASVMAKGISSSMAQPAGRASERRSEDLAMPAWPVISSTPARIMMNAMMFQVRS